MVRFLQRLFREEDGQGLVEYGLIIALVALVVVGLLSGIGGQLVAKFQDIVDTLTNAGPPGAG